MTHSDRATPDTAELTIDSAVADESHGSTPVLEAEDVTKAYPGEPPVLIPFKQGPQGRQEVVFAREKNDKDYEQEVIDFQTLPYEMRKQRAN